MAMSLSVNTLIDVCIKTKRGFKLKLIHSKEAHEVTRLQFSKLFFFEDAEHSLPFALCIEEDEPEFCHCVKP